MPYTNLADLVPMRDLRTNLTGDEELVGLNNIQLENRLLQELDQFHGDAYRMLQAARTRHILHKGTPDLVEQNESRGLRSLLSAAIGLIHKPEEADSAPVITQELNDTGIVSVEFPEEVKIHEEIPTLMNIIVARAVLEGWEEIGYILGVNAQITLRDSSVKHCVVFHNGFMFLVEDQIVNGPIISLTSIVDKLGESRTLYDLMPQESIDSFRLDKRTTQRNLLIGGWNSVAERNEIQVRPEFTCLPIPEGARRMISAITIACTYLGNIRR
jgi:hypothetical protein